MATPINKHIIQKIIERNEVNLPRQQAALKETLDAIDMLTSINTDGAYTNAIEALRVKRNRQLTLAKATEQAIAGYRQLLKKA